MYYESGINEYFKEIIKGRASFPLISILVLSLLTSAFLFIALQLEQGIVVSLIILSILFLYLIINHPRLWIYSIAAFTFVYFKESSEGISAVDYASAILYSGSLMVWIVWMKLINRIRITDSAADWLIILFFSCFLFNFVVAVANGNDILGWLREALRGIIILYFIPIKYYFKDTEDLKKLLAVFALSVIISALWQFYDYYRILHLDAVYLYQLGTSVRLNQALFSSATVFGFAFLIYYTKLKNQVFLFIITALAFGGLFTSFSRSFWLVVALNTFILFIFVPLRKKIKISAFVIIALTILVYVIFNIFGDKSKYMMMMVENRIGSSFQGRKDVSVDMRFVEYNAVYGNIAENPFGGNGMGSKIKFYYSGNKAVTVTHNIHNSYLFTAQRYGIPMALVFFSALILYLIKSFKLAISIKGMFDKLLILGAFNTMLMLIITSFTSAVIFYRDGSVITAFTIAIIGIIDNKYRNFNGGIQNGR